MQRTIEDCTLHSVYVKNDYFYKKLKDAQSGGELDLSIDTYFNKVHQSIAELKDVSIGYVSIHVLPESQNDKSSGNSEDVADDIIGTTSCDFHFEGDQVGMFEWENTVSENKYDKASLKNMLDKLKIIYAQDEYLSGALDEYSTFRYKTKELGNGWTETTTDTSSDPFMGEIAYLNECLQPKSQGDMQDPRALMLKRFLESLKEKNENTLLESSASSQRLGFVLKELQD
jgi:hypothetical protein